MYLFRSIIATGSAFRSVENKQFENMVQLLRPGTVLPTRQLVSGTLLDEIYDIEKAKVSSLVTGLEGTLLVDGWSDLTNHPVIGVAFVANGQCYLVTTVDTTGTPHTSENLADIVKEQKLECEATYNVKIGSLVCDNAANMVRMREILTNDIGIHVFGCGAHFLNLLAKDICQSKETKTALSKVLEIVKYLRNTHSALAKLREKQLRKPPIPVETRWNSQQEMVKYFISNWMEIVCIISSLLNRRDRLYQYVEDIQLKRVCMDMLEVLDPVASALDSMQKDSTTVSDSVVIWKHLLEKCPGSHKEFVVTRMNMAISPAVMAANVLDHRYQGSKLTSIEMTAAFDYIKNYSPGAFPQVMIYMAKEAPFSSNLFGKDYENISATSWWKTGRRLGFPDDLVNVALPLVAAASSSAGLERQFSTLGFTYGTLRAQLGVEKAGKIAFLYRELNK